MHKLQRVRSQFCWEGRLGWFAGSLPVEQVGALVHQPDSPQQALKPQALPESSETQNPKREDHILIRYTDEDNFMFRKLLIGGVLWVLLYDSL